MRRILIVGGGIGAHRLLTELLDRGADGCAITLVCGEPDLPYDRVRLGEVIEGRADTAGLALAPVAWYRERGINLHLGTMVTALDCRARAVTLSDGTGFLYDRLVLATGSEAIIPEIPGVDHRSVSTYRTLEDAHRLAATGARVVVIGGGLLGIEAACSLRARGREVTLVHRGSWLLDRQIDREAARLLHRDLGARGVSIETDGKVVGIEGDAGLRGVRLGDGRLLGADAVVLATGARPSTWLARAAGLTCRRGIVVDDGLGSTDPRIFALGECAEHAHITYGVVQPILEQAAVLARRLTGDVGARYPGSMPLTTLKVDGLALASVGAPSADDSLVVRDPGRGVYRRLSVTGGRLVGAVLYGDTRDGAWFAELIRQQTPIAAVRGELIFGRAVVEAKHGDQVVRPRAAALDPTQGRLAA